MYKYIFPTFSKAAGCFVSIWLLVVLCVSLILLPVGSATAQTAGALPTRFNISNRPADLTVFENLNRNGLPSHKIVTGDFNGDGVEDLLVTRSDATGPEQFTG